MDSGRCTIKLYAGSNEVPSQLNSHNCLVVPSDAILHRYEQYSDLRLYPA